MTIRMPVSQSGRALCRLVMSAAMLSALAACTSARPTGEAGLYAMLDPPSGLTYQVPLRCTLCSHPEAARIGASGMPVSPLAGFDELPGRTLDASQLAAVGAVRAPLDDGTVASPPAGASPAPVTGSHEAAGLVEPFKLKLDVEFASAGRLTLSGGAPLAAAR
jgi:hypothetical protein